MKVLSLFDGMSCGRIALDRAGIPVTQYYASELDKYAIKVAQANYPDTVQLGDVTKWRDWDIDWASIDLLIGGSPCQGFSFAGKQLAFNDPRSKLFFVYVDILNHIRSVNPDVKFMLENVKMKREYLIVISDHLGVAPVFINSSFFSACERPRYYWANWHIEEKTTPSRIGYAAVVRDDCVEMSDSWNTWWGKNKDFQLKKKYAKIPEPGEKGITMVARQYASWNGNFVIKNRKICKPNKRALARLVGAPEDYFGENITQRQAEVMTGNGWTVDVIAHIFRAMLN